MEIIHLIPSIPGIDADARVVPLDKLIRYVFVSRTIVESVVEVKPVTHNYHTQSPDTIPRIINSVVVLRPPLVHRVHGAECLLPSLRLEAGVTDIFRIVVDVILYRIAETVCRGFQGQK